MSAISNLSGVNHDRNFPIKESKSANNTFNETLGYALNDVSNLITDVNGTVEKMIKGKVDDIHEVMTVVQKVSIGLELVVEIRNKMFESYSYT